jgi:uncharacterized integral membrane protein
MRILLAIPVLIVLVVFALSNRQVVQLGLWPTDIMVDLPLSVTVLVAAGLFFIAGALMTWGASVAMRARAKRAERTVRQLEAEIQALKSRPSVGGSAMALRPPGA